MMRLPARQKYKSTCICVQLLTVWLDGQRFEKSKIQNLAKMLRSMWMCRPAREQSGGVCVSCNYSRGNITKEASAIRRTKCSVLWITTMAGAVEITCRLKNMNCHSSQLLMCLHPLLRETLSTTSTLTLSPHSTENYIYWRRAKGLWQWKWKVWRATIIARQGVEKWLATVHVFFIHRYVYIRKYQPSPPTSIIKYKISSYSPTLYFNIQVTEYQKWIKWQMSTSAFPFRRINVSALESMLITSY